MRWTGNYARLVALLLGLQLIGSPSDATAAKSARTLYNEAVAAEKRLRNAKKLNADKDAWIRVARAYHKVVLSHPRSGYCDDALYYEGEIYRQVDKRFRDRDAVRRALDAYLLLVDGYPASKWCSQARLARADLYLNRLSNLTAARKELRTVVSRWPRSTEAKEAQRILARLNGSNKKADRRVAVRNIRHFTGKKYTRIVIDLEKEVKYRRGRLKKPDRIYFDLLDTRLSQSLASLTVPIDDGFLKQIRVGQNKADVVRVVLDFESISQYNVFSLHNPYRLVVDILGIKPEKPAAVARKQVPTSARATPSTSGTGGPSKGNGDGEASATSPSLKTASTSESEGTTGPSRAESVSMDLPLPPEPTSDGRFPLARQLGLSARRVIIDPGHGGHDPGTRSRDGLQEKELVLDISRRVAKLLEQDGEYDVLMTRNADTFIPLEERTAIANSHEADLFVSIHANAHPNRRVRGIETFYLNLATTPDAEETAARENAVSTRRMGELQEIFRQIMNNSRIAESGDFATRLQDAMVREVLGGNRNGSRNHGVKTAPFYVLLGANMPSVLIEVSFLSNNEDARLVSRSEYRQRLAEAITLGIRDYTASLKKIARVPVPKPVIGQESQSDNH
jgi:N-acetylmuramoyl-L-alanine amidase